MVITDNGRPVMVSENAGLAQFAETFEWGSRLAEAPCQVTESTQGGLWQARGWKEFVSHLPESKRATAAVMLENCRKKFGGLNEATRTASLGSFDKWIFPVISNMVENDVIDQLVAVQPMPGPTSQIVYMDIVTSQAKGSVPAGAPMWRALQGASDRYTDSDELVQDEDLGTTNSGGSLASTTGYFPVRPGTLTVAIGAGVAQDDSNGNITGSFTGTINYVTGAITIASAGNNANAVATYAFDSEGNKNIMGYEMKLTSTPVTAKTRKLKTIWSEEADQNLQAMYNIKAENILLSAITGALQYQKHRDVIYDLRARANAGVVTWDATPPANVSYQAHKFSIIDAFETASNFIFGATNMMQGNWVLAGLQAITVITTLPQFSPKGNQTEMQGLTYIGDLGRFKIYADPHFPQDEFLVGYKGDQFLRCGAVLAEYQKLYTTPNVVLPDFLNQRGFATSYAKKVINSKCYARGFIQNAPTSYGTVIG